MPTETHDTKTLNSLLTTVVDSIDGFEQAVKSTETGAFKSIFEEVIADRRGLAGEIKLRSPRQVALPTRKARCSLRPIAS